MTDNLVDLDAWRGQLSRRDAESRRQAANDTPQHAPPLLIYEEEFEEFLMSTTADGALETLAKAKYLIQLLSSTAEGRNPRRAILIDNALKEIDRHFE